MTELRLYNTLSRNKEIFKPIDPNNIRMYVCGPTVYDFAHLGNARPVVVFDTLFRLLQRLYPKVTYVRNITDVDDKIMAKAKESGEAIEVVTRRTTQAYHDDMVALNTLPPTIEPRATQSIPQMIALIETLIDKGHAYAAEGHVLFNVPSMKGYGQLSRRSHDELIAGGRVEVAPYKKDAADFVLWKPSAADQPGWDSPWDRGRPGWHIECSAMAKEHLGETFDIHGGGLDLIFPHHENEIAQSRCAHDGAKLANYWMHNGFLTINSDKMSKSLGNFFTVRQLLEKYHGEVIRLTLLSAHYRQPLDFSDEALLMAKARLDRWYGALRDRQYFIANPDKKAGNLSLQLDNILKDDLNTPLAISFLDQQTAIFREAELSNDFAEDLLLCAQALGLLYQDPEAWFKWQPASQSQSGPTETEIEEQIAARLDARKNRNFAESDSIRDALLAQGIILEDKASGTTWRRK